MTWEQLHPAINAALNMSAFVLLVLGRMAIARGDDATHRRRMLAAFTTSGVFLVSYLIRFATTGTHTIRIQPREDGIVIDQIVLSAVQYLNTSPGALKDDTMILPR